MSDWSRPHCVAQAVLTRRPPASACQGLGLQELFLLDKAYTSGEKCGENSFLSLVDKVKNAVRSARPAEPLKAAYICSEKFHSKKSLLHRPSESYFRNDSGRGLGSLALNKDL